MLFVSILGGGGGVGRGCGSVCMGTLPESKGAFDITLHDCIAARGKNKLSALHSKHRHLTLHVYLFP